MTAAISDGPIAPAAETPPPGFAGFGVGSAVGTVVGAGQFDPLLPVNMLVVEVTPERSQHSCWSNDEAK